MTYVMLMRLTDKGRADLARAADWLTTANEIAAKHGGRYLHMWSTTGHYDFVAVSRFAAAEDALRARLELYELGLFEIDVLEAFDLEVALAAV